MQCECGGNSVITKTVDVKRGIRRERVCQSCHTKFVTYERPKEDGLTDHEMRLVSCYKVASKPIRKALWALLRT